MDDRQLDRLRDEESRQRFEIRRIEERLARGQKELEDAGKRFEDGERRAERDIEDEFRDEHFGHDPERPWTWREKG